MFFPHHAVQQNDMDCEAVKKIIPAYIDRFASDDEVGRVEEHLCVCPECRAYLSRCMDNPPNIAAKKVEKDYPQIEPWDYVILGIGIIVLGFFLYLLIK